MNTSTTLRRAVGASLFLGVFLMMAVADANAQSRERMVRGVNVSSEYKKTTIDIHLAVPARYLTHVPSEKGDSVRIRIAPEGQGRSTEDREIRRQVTPWRGSGEVPLVDVVYDEELAPGPSLILHFEYPVEFYVRQTSDLLLISVELRDIDSGAIHKPASVPSTPKNTSTLTTKDVPARTLSEDAKVSELMALGRAALVDGDNSAAIRIFTKVLIIAEDASAQEAKELLGLARQRNGQLAHAKAEYQEYLELYPASEGAGRVQQRLDALYTAALTPKAPHRDKRLTKKSRNLPTVFGSLSEYFRLDLEDTETDGVEATHSTLDTDLFFDTRLRGERFSSRLNFDGGFQNGFATDRGDSFTDTRISYLFTEIKDEATKLSFRLGRQSGTNGGVLGRFDGVTAGWEFRPDWRLKLRYGFPVSYSETSGMRTDHPFFGASIDVASLFENWDAELYIIQQENKGIGDRRAIGGELRFVGERNSLFLFADYDLSYGELNNFYAIGNARATDALSFYMSLDYRKSPFLFTQNALQGQPEDSLDDLIDRIGESAAESLAEDRSATSKTGTLGATYQIRPFWSLGAEVTLSSISGTPESSVDAVVVDEMPGTGTEIFYSVDITRMDLFTEGDYSTLSLRYAALDASDRYTADLSGRFPVWRRLRIGPRIRYDLRQGHDGVDVSAIKPSIRFDYRLKRVVSLELELGGEWIHESGGLSSFDETRYFVTLALHYDF